MTGSKKHWEDKYSEDAPMEVSWYQAVPSVSLKFIEHTGLAKGESLIDVGGGASTLVDSLIKLGFENIGVLDISSVALEHTQQRLGSEKNKVEWIVSDIKTFESKHKFSVWHDRAVFHFLTEEKDRQEYLRVLKATLVSRGHFVIATFALDGPTQCSGLDVARYDSDSLAAFFGDDFELLETEAEVHKTPWNSAQKFVYCRFKALL